MAHDDTDLELDEDGLVVQTYQSMVLVVMPPAGYGEQTLRYARSSLYNVHVGTVSVSTETDELIKGRLQDEFMVDGPLAGETIERYSGVLFVGGEGALALVQNADALRLAREAAGDGKLVAAWGQAVGILGEAGVLKGRRFTGPPELRDTARRFGGKYTSREVEVHKNVVTGKDDAVGMRFGQRLAQIVGI